MIIKYLMGGFLMGFWSGFFGHAVANAYNDVKKEEKETQKWNDLFHEKLQLESEFNDFLKSIGIKDFYIADVEHVNNGSILPIKREIDYLRNKVDEYLSLGGDARILYDLDDIDKHIDKLKYLRDIGQLDRQYEFIDATKYTIQDKIKAEQEEVERQQKPLRKKQKEQYRQDIDNIVGTDINSLSGVEFEKVCQQLVENMGFETETTKASGDNGIDLIAYNHQPLLSGKYIIQCKRYSGSVGEPIIRDLYGVVMSERANKGILMTTGYFTRSAISFAEGKPIELIGDKKLYDLLSSYGIAEFDEAEEIDNKTPQDVFANNIMVEDEYKKYENSIRELDKTNDECKRASFINWLINLTMGKFADIVDFQEKIIIFREIKNQIRKYTDSNRIEKSKLLSYLYQMTYVQLSILEGDFNDAKDMFEKLMEHKELQLSLMETIKESPEEVHITDFLYDHQGIFTWLCYTWYDMVQVAILVDDSSYKMHLTDHNLFYGFPVLEVDRLKRTITEIDSGLRTVGNRSYFVEKLNGFKDIDSMVYNEVPLRQLFFIDGYALDVYYRYTYEDDGYLDFAPELYKIVLDGNDLKIDGIGKIENIRQKINKWTIFSV